MNEIERIKQDIEDQRKTLIEAEKALKEATEWYYKQVQNLQALTDELSNEVTF